MCPTTKSNSVRKQALLARYPSGTPGRRIIEFTAAVRKSFKEGGYRKALEDWYVIKEKPPSRRVGPIRLNEEQLDLLSTMEQQWAETGRVRIIILKARQIGFSTLIQGISFIDSFLKARNFASTIGMDAANAVHLHSMTRTALKEFPGLDKEDQEKFPLVRDAMEGTEFPAPLSSIIEVLTAGSRGSGRGRTTDFAHYSEVAFYTTADEFLLGHEQSLPDLGSKAFKESTANGVGNLFYREWKSAETGTTDWIPKFYPWFKHRAYAFPFRDDEDRQAFAASLSTVEERLLTIGCSLENLKWRRWCIRNKCQNDPRRFQQEYPATADEAFLTSGRPTFDPDKMQLLIQHCMENPPIRKGYFRREEE